MKKPAKYVALALTLLGIGAVVCWQVTRDAARRNVADQADLNNHDSTKKPSSVNGGSNEAAGGLGHSQGDDDGEGSQSIFYYDESTLSAHVKILVGDEDVASQERRVKLAWELPSDMSRGDVAVLKNFLANHKDEDDVLDGLSFFSLKNDILDQIIARDQGTDGLGYFIADMALDKEQEGVWRDYCFQHIAQYAQRRWSSGSAPNSLDGRNELRYLISALNQGVSEVETTISGTSLIGLQSVYRQFPELDAAELIFAVTDLTANESVPDITRVTALQICSEMRISEVLPHARDIALHHATIPMQLSAIQYLKENGTKEDLAILAKLKTSPTTYLRKASESAFTALSNRVYLTEAQ